MNKTELSQKLADGLTYYVKNPKRRCVSEDGCFYSGKTMGNKSKGCLVGAMLTPSQREELDEKFYQDGILEIISNVRDEPSRLSFKLPDFIVKNKEVIREFQSIHDTDWNWSKSGLSIMGRAELAKVIREYKLIKKPFKHLLK